MTEPPARPRTAAAVLVVVGSAAVVVGSAMVRYRADQLYPADRLVLGLVVAVGGVLAALTGLLLAVAARRRR